MPPTPTASDTPPAQTIIQEPEPPPLTAYEEPLNPQIPGPSVVPGLWD
jgi:hypothetical protein